MIDYARKDKQRFIAEASKRTPIYREEPFWQTVLGGCAFALFALVVMFV